MSASHFDDYHHNGTVSHSQIDRWEALWRKERARPPEDVATDILQLPNKEREHALGLLKGEFVPDPWRRASAKELAEDQARHDAVRSALTAAGIEFSQVKEPDYPKAVQDWRAAHLSNPRIVKPHPAP